MYYPSPWHATSECNPDTMYPKECKFELKDKSQKCEHGSNGCNRGAGWVSWFTNFTVVPEATIEEEMYAQAPRSSHAGLHPWNSPGFAPTYGNGCGLNGGNPDGCDGEGIFSKYLVNCPMLFSGESPKDTENLQSLIRQNIFL